MKTCQDYINMSIIMLGVTVFSTDDRDHAGPTGEIV